MGDVQGTGGRHGDEVEASHGCADLAPNLILWGGRIRHAFWIGKGELEDGQHIFSFGVTDILAADDPNRLNRRSIANPTELLVILTGV